MKANNKTLVPRALRLRAQGAKITPRRLAAPRCRLVKGQPLPLRCPSVMEHLLGDG